MRTNAALPPLPDLSQLGLNNSVADDVTAYVSAAANNDFFKVETILEDLHDGWKRSGEPRRQSPSDEEIFWTTQLQLACLANSYGGVALALRNGADQHTFHATGCTPEELTTSRDIKRLLGGEEDLTDPLVAKMRCFMEQAGESGGKGPLELFLNHPYHDLPRLHAQRCDLLHHAVYWDAIEIVMCLIRSGCDVNTIERHQRPIERARSCQMLSILRDAGAKIDDMGVPLLETLFAGDCGKDVLHRIAWFGSAKADFNARDKEGATILIRFVRRNERGRLRRKLQGTRPAVQDTYDSFLFALIEGGARVCLEDYRDRVAVHYITLETPAKVADALRVPGEVSRAWEEEGGCDDLPNYC